MPERRKFAALTDLHRQESEASEIPAPEPQTPAVALKLEKGRGRPATGKRSNPEYKLYAHYLKKRTHRLVTAKLAALYTEEDQQPDLSNLMQELLEEWLARQ
jgi:hypothetical protein